MSSWDNLKNNLKSIASGKAATASPEVIAALGEHRANFLVNLGGTNKRIQYLFDTAVNASYGWYYTNSPAVRTVVDLLASNVAQLDLRLYDEIDVDEREEVPDHPAAVALRYPNEYTSSDQFIRYMLKSWLLYDNAFALKVRERQNGPLQFVWLPPERVKVQGRGLRPEFYIIQYQNGSESEPYPADQMLHWRGENFDDPRIGASRLETLRAVIAEEAAMSQAIVELAKSGLAEPSWVSRPLEAAQMEWSNEARERFEEDLSNRLRSSNTKPPVLEEGMRLEGFGVSPKDAEMLAVRKYAMQQVASLYGVPLGMVGLDDNIEAAQEEFYADTLPPLCENFCRQLNLQVVQEEFHETELYFEFDLDEKQQGSERLKAYTAAAGVPPFTRNEIRAKLGLPPVEGGDEPMTPANMLPGSDPEALLTQPTTNPPGSKPADNVMPIQNPNGPDQGGGAREGDQGVKPSQSAVSDAIRKHIARVASAKKWNRDRSDRELTKDLLGAGMNGEAELLAGVVNDQLERGLNNGSKAEVFNQAKAEAPQLAARWEMRPEQMKELGIPTEMVWERMGFSPDEIDRMSAMRWADDLAENGSVPENH